VASALQVSLDSLELHHQVLAVILEKAVTAALEHQALRVNQALLPLELLATVVILVCPASVFQATQVNQAFPRLEVAAILVIAAWAVRALRDSLDRAHLEFQEHLVIQVLAPAEFRANQELQHQVFQVTVAAAEQVVILASEHLEQAVNQELLVLERVDQAAFLAIADTQV
jgi:hypothetical protein